MKQKYFYGNEVSEYGQEHGYVDYRTFAAAFQCVLNNNIINHDAEWELISCPDDIENFEVFQWFIVNNFGAELCERYGEVLYYSHDLDIYLWGVTHWGTSWEYVLTDIKLKELKEK